MTIRVVFMGSPEFALPSLRVLATRGKVKEESFYVAGVVTQPDRPAGRGRNLKPPAVKSLALEKGIPVIQPEKINQPDAAKQLKKWSPDLIVVAAFGQILKPDILNIPKHGCVNVHASLLPRWRGAAPVQAAILHGDEETGVTIMKMDAGLDTGPILSQCAIQLSETDTAGFILDTLSKIGADLLIKTLPGYVNGKIPPQAQSEEGVTYATILKKEDGHLDFHHSADELSRRVRACNPWPGATMDIDGKPLKIHRAHGEPTQDIQSEAGARIIHKDLPTVITANGLLVLDEVQPAGKKLMAGKAFLAGMRNWETVPPAPGSSTSSRSFQRHSMQ